MIIWFLLIFILVLLLLFIPLARYIRKKPWPQRAKGLVWSLMSAFTLFPVLVPGGTIGAFPLPNVFAFGMFVKSGGIEGLIDFILWYLKIPFFHMVSYFITFVIFYGMAAFVFFKYDRKEKPAPEKEQT